MASSLGKFSGSLAMKRARSQDRRSRNASPSPAPVAKAPKTEEQAEDVGVPAFLRQSKAEINIKFQDLEWQQQLRLAHGRADPLSPWAQDTAPLVRMRNRVPLSPSSSITYCDPRLTGTVPAAESETTYIVTQGPKQASLSHFWQMIWHETSEIAVIVMLTQTAEAGKEKCFQYFPLGEEARNFRLEAASDEETGLEGKVQLVETVYNEAARSFVRKLVMTVGEADKIVWHLLFSGWPDFDIPEGDDRAALLELLKLSASKNDMTNNPRIIHCSAGVGRSGTFIALEFLLAQLEAGVVAEAKEDEDMIYDLVNRLREQRMLMVQSDIQYQFLYHVLHEQFKLWQVSQVAGEGGPSEMLHRSAKGTKSDLHQLTSRENGHEEGEAHDKPNGT